MRGTILTSFYWLDENLIVDSILLALYKNNEYFGKIKYFPINTDINIYIYLDNVLFFYIYTLTNL